MTGDSKPSAEDMDAAIAALSQHGDPLRPYQVEAVAKAIAERVNREVTNAYRGKIGAELDLLISFAHQRVDGRAAPTRGCFYYECRACGGTDEGREHLHVRPTIEGVEHKPDCAVASIRDSRKAFAASFDAVNREPIPMVLHCPSCGAQHIDAPEPENGWDNPPHRSHSCHTCKTVWRPADVATTGVTAIATRGSADNWTGFTVGDAFRNADEALNCEIERRREAEAQSLPEIIVTPLAKLQDLDPASVIALADVAQERLRQINGEGWTATHDDVEHQAGELALAAAAYAKAPHTHRRRDTRPPAWWPWHEDWWKPGSLVRNRIKAGALLIAEMARHYRSAPPGRGNR